MADRKTVRITRRSVDERVIECTLCFAEIEYGDDLAFVVDRDSAGITVLCSGCCDEQDASRSSQ